MAYFAPYLDSTGLHLPTYQDRLDNLCEAYRNIFGQEAELNPATPDYQLLSVLSKALDDVSALMLQVFNSRDPNYAAGTALDLLMPQYGLTRQEATKSRATLKLTGTAGTVVPAGSMFGDTNGHLWKSRSAATIASNGTGSVLADCETLGAIYAAVNTITTIVHSISGLESVTNTAGAVMGLDEETDAEARARINAAFAGQSYGTAEAIEAGIRGIANVLKVKVYVNDGDLADANGIPGHTVAAVVLGGNQTNILKMIFNKKAPGIGTYGSTTASVTIDGQSHSVSFSRPNSKFVYFMVNIKALAGFDAEAVKAAITQEITDIVGEVDVGETLIMPSMFGRCYAATGALAGTFVIQSILGSATATDSSPSASTTEEIALGWNDRFELQAQYGIQFTIT